MSDYISREAAINAVYEAYADGESAYDALEKLPAADVREVKRGKWEEHSATVTDSPYYTCSVCGSMRLVKAWNFCPVCGAQMEEQT